MAAKTDSSKILSGKNHINTNLNYCQFIEYNFVKIIEIAAILKTY